MAFDTQQWMVPAMAAQRTWAQTSRLTRRALLQAWGRELATASGTLALALTRETGKPITLARGELARGITTLEATVEALASFGEEAIPYDLMAGAEGCRATLRRVAKGVVLAITPFNFPVNLALHKLGPALGAGCVALWKPSPYAVETSRLLWQTFEKARSMLGAPDHLIQLLQVEPAQAEALAQDPAVAVVSFTGSERVGLHLRDLLPHKTVVLELGGNAAVVVDASLDPGRITPALASAAMAGAGQSCCKAQRFYIHESLWEVFVPAFLDAVRALPVGDPMDPATVVGPLIDEAAAIRLDGALDRAPTVLLRGSRRGALLPPAVLTDVPESDPLQCEELFGPIAVLTKVPSFEEGVTRAAATRFGLRASVYTRDPLRWRWAEQRLRAGTVLWNLPPTFRLDAAPFGGLGVSGQGLEGPRWALESFTEARLVVEGPGF